MLLENCRPERKKKRNNNAVLRECYQTCTPCCAISSPEEMLHTNTHIHIHTATDIWSHTNAKPATLSQVSLKCPQPHSAYICPIIPFRILAWHKHQSSLPLFCSIIGHTVLSCYDISVSSPRLFAAQLWPAEASGKKTQVSAFRRAWITSPSISISLKKMERMARTCNYT